MNRAMALVVLLAASLSRSAVAQSVFTTRFGVPVQSPVSGAAGALSAPPLAPGPALPPAIAPSALAAALPNVLPAAPAAHAIPLLPALAGASAVAKDGESGDQTRPERLASMFDGGKKRSAEENASDGAPVSALASRQTAHLQEWRPAPARAASDRLGAPRRTNRAASAEYEKLKKEATWLGVLGLASIPPFMTGMIMRSSGIINWFTLHQSNFTLSIAFMTMFCCIMSQLGPKHQSKILYSAIVLTGLGNIFFESYPFVRVTDWGDLTSGIAGMAIYWILNRILPSPSHKT